MQAPATRRRYVGFPKEEPSTMLEGGTEQIQLAQTAPEARGQLRRQSSTK